MVWPAEIRYREGGRKGGKTFERIGEQGEYMIPTAFVEEATGKDDTPDASVRFEVRDGRPECVEIVIKAKPDGRPILTSDMGRFRSIDQLIETAVAANAKRTYPDAETGTRWRGPRGEEEVWAARKAVYQRRASRANSPEELVQVAEIYREHIDGAPLDAIQQLMDYGSHRTAARRVEMARKAGLLPPTDRGRKKA